MTGLPQIRLLADPVEAVGKRVKALGVYGRRGLVAFEDGTALVFCGSQFDMEIEDDAAEWDLVHLMRQVKLISNDAADAYFKQQHEEWRRTMAEKDRREYERLKAKFEAKE